MMHLSQACTVYQPFPFVQDCQKKKVSALISNHLLASHHEKDEKTLGLRPQHHFRYLAEPHKKY